MHNLLLWANAVSSPYTQQLSIIKHVKVITKHSKWHMPDICPSSFLLWTFIDSCVSTNTRRQVFVSERVPALVLVTACAISQRVSLFSRESRTLSQLTMDCAVIYNLTTGSLEKHDNIS